MRLYDLPIGTIEPCKMCGSLLELCEMPDYKGEPFRYWSDCSCIGRAASRSLDLTARSNAYQAEQRTEVIADPIPLGNFVFATFDPMRLPNGGRLLSIVHGWLAAIDGLPVSTSYSDKPYAALYFYSPGKGRGKTHMAGAVVNQVRADGRSAVLVDEVSYIESYWAATLEDKKRLSALPGERAWLTVIDDLGQRERTTDTLRDAWYDVVNPRWLKRGWTIFTSNWTPDELHKNGTINEASYSRIVQMTQGRLITFEGADQRLLVSEAN